jgi:hypothetical protein
LLSPLLMTNVLMAHHQQLIVVAYSCNENSGATTMTSSIGASNSTTIIIFHDVLETTYTFDNDNLHRNSTAMREKLEKAVKDRVKDTLYTIARGNATLNITGTIGNEFTQVDTTKDYEALKQAIEFHVTNAPGWISVNQTTGSQPLKLEVGTDLICYNKEDRSTASCTIALVFK